MSVPGFFNQQNQEHQGRHSQAFILML